jgi:hypothetical protein
MKDEINLLPPRRNSYSSFRLHPSSLPFPPRAKKVLHHFAAFLLKHAGGNFDSMIQEFRIADPKSRFHRTGALIGGAVDEPRDSRLYQCPGAHHTRFDGGINHRIRESIIGDLMRCFTQRNDLCMCGWILIRARSVSGDRQNYIAGNDARANRDLVTRARVLCCRERLTHPVRIRFSLLGGSHNRNIPVKQRKIEL